MTDIKEELPKEPRKPVPMTVTITHMPDGRVEVSTNVQNYMTAIGMMDFAKHILIKEMQNKGKETESPVPVMNPVRNEPNQNS